MSDDKSWVLARYPSAAVACLEESGLPGWVATKVRGSGVLLAWGPTEAEVWRGARQAIEKEGGSS